MAQSKSQFETKDSGESASGEGVKEKMERVFMRGVRDYLDEKLPKTTIKDASQATMDKWEKDYLSVRGLEWTPGTRKYVEATSGLGDLITKAMDVPLGKIPFLPDGITQRTFAAIAQRGPVLDPIDRFLFLHYPWILGTQEKR